MLKGGEAKTRPHETLTNANSKVLYRMNNIINRPGVAGAVLQSPPLLINSLIDSVILFLPVFKTS